MLVFITGRSPSTHIALASLALMWGRQGRWPRHCSSSALLTGSRRHEGKQALGSLTRLWGGDTWRWGRTWRYAPGCQPHRIAPIPGPIPPLSRPGSAPASPIPSHFPCWFTYSRGWPVHQWCTWEGPGHPTGTLAVFALPSCAAKQDWSI